MSSEELIASWTFWVIVGGVIVLAAAVLLLVVLWAARRIKGLAETALPVVETIRENTQVIWELERTNRTARTLHMTAESILDNAGAIAQKLGGADARREGGV